MNKLEKYWDDVHLKYISSYDGWLDKYIKLIKKEDYIVELGCGRAYCSKELLNKGYENVVACDFLNEVLKILNNENPELKTMLFDMSKGLPFNTDSVNIIIADLSLHYFNKETTIFLFEEINRVLKENGYLIARVNSTNDFNHISSNSREIEKNFYYDGKIYKRFFEKDDFNWLFNKFKVCNLEEKDMNRYGKPKILWEFCVKK